MKPLQNVHQTIVSAGASPGTFGIQDNQQEPAHWYRYVMSVEARLEWRHVTPSSTSAEQKLEKENFEWTATNFSNPSV